MKYKPKTLLLPQVAFAQCFNTATEDELEQVPNTLSREEQLSVQLCGAVPAELEVLMQI